MKIAIIWSHLPGHAYACMMEAHKILGDNLWCASLGELPAYLPDSEKMVKRGIKIFTDQEDTGKTSDKILQSLSFFNPDIFIISGWSKPVARLTAKRLRRKGVITVCMADTPLLNTLKQCVRRVLGRWIVHRCYDVIWVPGEQGEKFAHTIGYKEPYLWRNLLSADAGTFNSTTELRLKSSEIDHNWPKSFLFVGRLVADKNIKRIIKAYKIYYYKAKEPWPLVLVGDGPLRKAAQNVKGISCLGWIGPDKVAAIMRKTGCFLLTSSYDPWPLVVHEAACSGLPIITSNKVWASNELVRDLFNGRIVDYRKPAKIADALLWVSEHDEPWMLGARSYEMSKQISPAIWAKYLVNKAAGLLKLKKDRYRCTASA